jgi:PqqD family protein of HPr-rel-A system
MTLGPSSDAVWTRRQDRRPMLQRSWGEELVVYDPLSGGTHLLDPVAAAVLDYLSASDGSAAAIARALMADFDASCEEDVLAAVTSTLAKLRDIDLVQTAAQ